MHGIIVKRPLPLKKWPHPFNAGWYPAVATLVYNDAGKMLGFVTELDYVEHMYHFCVFPETLEHFVLPEDAYIVKDMMSSSECIQLMATVVQGESNKWNLCGPAYNARLEMTAADFNEQFVCKFPPEPHYIDVLGSDRKRHLALPHSDRAICGCLIISKDPKDCNGKFSCYECTY